MATFDQFANQGGAAAESADALAEARRVSDEQLKNADYAGDLPEPLGSGSEPDVTAPAPAAPEPAAPAPAAPEPDSE